MEIAPASDPRPVPMPTILESELERESKPEPQPELEANTESIGRQCLNNAQFIRFRFDSNRL